MKKAFIIIVICFISCSTIDQDKIETKKNGLTYFKETNNLVSGTVTRKFESGKIAEKTNYKNGKQIGERNAYGYSGEDINHGYSFELNKVIIEKFLILKLENATISFNVEAPFKWSSLSIPEIAQNVDRIILVKLSNEILRTYKDHYEFKEIWLEHKNSVYRFENKFYSLEAVKFDTIVNEEGRILIKVR